MNYKLFTVKDFNKLPDYFWNWYLDVLKYQVIKYTGDVQIKLRYVAICNRKYWGDTYQDIREKYIETNKAVFLNDFTTDNGITIFILSD